MGIPINNPCGAQIAIPYGTSVGCLRACPYWHAIWAPYGSYTAKPIWASHNRPIWDPDTKPIWVACGMARYGQAHIFTPLLDTYGLPTDNPIWAAHNGHMWGPDSKPKWAQYGMYTSCPNGDAHRIPIWVPYGQALMGTPIKDPCGPRQ